MVTAVDPLGAIADSDRRRFLDVRRVPETASTNADVLELARAGEREGIVVVADHQTAGRGRAGRRWIAPPGASLLCTVLLRPPAPVAPLATFALAVAAADAVAAVAGVDARLKWPNDVIVGTAAGPRKLAGILAEAEWPVGSSIASGYREPSATERVAVAAGIGLNVQWPSTLPDEIAEVATSLNLLTGRSHDRDAVLEALLDALDGHYDDLVSGRVPALLDAWRQRSSTLGATVRVDLGADDLVGTARDITDDGRLIVDTLEGERRIVAAGDVVHLRRGA